MKQIDRPDPASKQPALAIGAVSTGAALGLVLFARQLGVDPDLLAPLAAALAPIVTAVLVRTQVYSPATVAALLRARSEQEPADGPQ